MGSELLAEISQELKEMGAVEAAHNHGTKTEQAYVLRHDEGNSRGKSTAKFI